jgi:hypothetical protein
MKFTELQVLRQTLELDEQDLLRFLADPTTPAESIAVVRRAIEMKKAKIALYERNPAGEPGMNQPQS